MVIALILPNRTHPGKPEISMSEATCIWFSKVYSSRNWMTSLCSSLFCFFSVYINFMGGKYQTGSFYKWNDIDTECVSFSLKFVCWIENHFWNEKWISFSNEDFFFICLLFVLIFTIFIKYKHCYNLTPLSWLYRALFSGVLCVCVCVCVGGGGGGGGAGGGRVFFLFVLFFLINKILISIFYFISDMYSLCWVGKRRKTHKTLLILQIYYGGVIFMVI